MYYSIKAEDSMSELTLTCRLHNTTVSTPDFPILSRKAVSRLLI